GTGGTVEREAAGGSSATGGGSETYHFSTGPLTFYPPSNFQYYGGKGRNSGSGGSGWNGGEYYYYYNSGPWVFYPLNSTSSYQYNSYGGSGGAGGNGGTGGSVGNGGTWGSGGNGGTWGSGGNGGTWGSGGNEGTWNSRWRTWNSGKWRNMEFWRKWRNMEFWKMEEHGILENGEHGILEEHVSRGNGGCRETGGTWGNDDGALVELEEHGGVGEKVELLVLDKMQEVIVLAEMEILGIILKYIMKLE
ncbi:hypothetical protein TNIN_370311, partial [Trichonephila inaurata madagascariensis]